MISTDQIKKNEASVLKTFKKKFLQFTTLIKPKKTF